MENGYTKHVQIAFKFNDAGELIDGSIDGDKDSRFIGVTFFAPNGERSELGGKPSTIFTPYSKMTADQKIVFDKLISDYLSLKDQI